MIHDRPLVPEGCVPQCPGCAHRSLTRSQSLARKTDWLKARLAKWADAFDEIQSVDDERRWGYRTKVCLSARWENGRWRFGLKKKDMVIPIHDCPVHARQIREAMALFADRLPPDRLFPLAYYAQTGSQITLVVKSAKMPDLTWMDATLIQALNRIGVTGLWLHLHPSCGKKVFAKNAWHLIFGTPRSVDENGFVYGPRAFQQVIPSLFHEALASAEAFLAPAADDLFVDLYCGIGTGLAKWRGRCQHVIGVELDGEAVNCARENAPGAEILRGRCTDRIPQMGLFANAAAPGGKRLLFANPPRTGLEPEISDWIADHYQPDRMAYLSCSAGTLHRDLTRLDSAGFEIVKIIPYDFFPQTLHVETLTLLKNKKYR